MDNRSTPRTLALHLTKDMEGRDYGRFTHSQDFGEEPRSPSSTDSSIVTLKERIYDAVSTSINEQKFLPANFIDLFTTQDQVISALEEEDLKYDDELLVFASGEGKRVFLTLVEIENLAALEGLRASGFNDSHLPVGETKISPDKKKSGKKRKILYEIRSLDEASNTLRPERWVAFASDDWDNKSLKSFMHTQWLFLAPVFTKDKFRYIFHQNRPLPYVGDTDAPPKVGFFGRVTQVRIDDAHQQVLVRNTVK